MLRTAFVRLLRPVLHVFFSSVEIEGAERLPADASIVFALNHPNGLIDPLVLMCVAPCPVSFLAKEPLFRIPLLGRLLHAFDVMPVYRAMDNADTRQNVATFERARAILGRGGAIGIFPEGTTHGDPSLRPLKTGAARIALGAAADGSGRVTVVPAGLYYTNKGMFRSKVLLVYGAPIPVPCVEMEGEPPREAVQALSQQVREGLEAVTLNAEDAAAVEQAARGNRVLCEPDDTPGALMREFTLRRLFVAGQARLRALDPARLTALAQRTAGYEADAKACGVPAELVGMTPPALEQRRGNALAMALLALPAALGTVLNWPLYRFIGFVCDGLLAPRDGTVVSTVKLGISVVGYPLLWLAAGAAATKMAGVKEGLAVLLACPACGWSAVIFQERLARLREGVALEKVRQRNSSGYERLCEERDAIRDQIKAAGELTGVTPPSGSVPS